MSALLRFRPRVSVRARRRRAHRRRSDCGIRVNVYAGFRTVVRRWAFLLGLSVACTLALEAMRLPAALLLGPMVAAIAIAAMEIPVRVPSVPFVVAQGVVGCLIARSITPGIFVEIGKRWPLFALGVGVVIVASSALGYALARLHVLPGSTAVWGSSPGAATVMVLMAETSDADVRLVAIMQYLRVVCVAAIASVVAHLFARGAASNDTAIAWFPTLAEPHFALTLVVAIGGAFLGRRLGVPAGALLVPMMLGVAAQDTAELTIVLPPWLLAASYAFVAWTIGLRFTRSILAYAARALPRIVASILTLVVVCGAFGALLVWKAGIDPLTAYLATSPGGADTVAIIASGSKVDVPFVMTMQIARFVVVLFVGPSLSKAVARLTARPSVARGG